MLNTLSGRLSTLVEPVMESAIRISGWSSIAFVFAIFLFIFHEGAPAIVHTLNLRDFFGGVNWQPDSAIRPQFEILALLAGTASVTVLAMAIAVPAGFGAAIFTEFCGPKTREALKVVIECLAAIPSVVWGFIGYVVLNPIIHLGHGSPYRHQHPERRHHPRPDERADHHDRGGGRAQGGAG